jgi:transcriptional regulator with XRE-family HTH domain
MKRSTTVPSVVSAKPVRGESPKPPPAYGQYLERVMRSLGLNLTQLAEKTGAQYLTLMRAVSNNGEHRDRSVKGSSTFREALLAAGATNVADVPTNEDWAPPKPPRPALDPADEIVRVNLVRFREALQLDQFAAAFAIKIPHDELVAYETGERVPSTPMLARIAEAYGCSRGSLLEEAQTAPPVNPSRLVGLHFGGPGTPLLTSTQRAQLEAIAKDVDDRYKAERRALDEKTGKVVGGRRNSSPKKR